jgi:predicted xylose isomerase-like sugar epimerase
MARTAVAVTGITAVAGFDQLAQALEAKARSIAEAAAATAKLKASAPERAWRRAALLWPIFTKG